MLLHDARYTIAITPVQFDYNLDIQGGKYRDVSILNARSYPDAPLNNKVSSYITTEVHHIKNSSFCFTKSNTDDLKDISKMQLYIYHTTGFIKRGES